MNYKNSNPEIGNPGAISIAFLDTPIGLLRITGDRLFLHRIEFVTENSIAQQKLIPSALSHVGSQLDEYFNGSRKEFDLELRPEGTDFQLRVWKKVGKVKFGQVTTYLNMAINLGDKGLLRAVGGANGANPIPIVIPCHRVIGAEGRLIGYGGGLWRKQWLLEHEGFKYSPDPDQMDLF